jgi:hypothetical protein
MRKFENLKMEDDVLISQLANVGEISLTGGISESRI